MPAKAGTHAWQRQFLVSVDPRIREDDGNEVLQLIVDATVGAINRGRLKLSNCGMNISDDFRRLTSGVLPASRGVLPDLLVPA